MQKLYESRRNGGLALPNVKLYNIAFEMAKLAKHWASYGSHLGWTHIEEEIRAPSKPIETLSQNVVGNMTGCDGNPIFHHSRVVWAKLHKMLRISQYWQDYASIWNNPSLKIDKKPVLWKSCLEGDLNKVGDLYKDGMMEWFVIWRNQYTSQPERERELLELPPIKKQC